MKSIEQKVIKFVDHYNLIKHGEKILIALSGGPDSVFTLFFFNKFKSRFGVTLAAAHLNHSLRGKSSDKDEEFCKSFCKKLEIDFFSEKINVKEFSKKNKISIEEAARKIRYNFLSGVSKNYRFDKIVTAHTMDDNAETVLLNLFKGTGLSGVAGIPIQRQNIIRPILSLTKEEVLSYLEMNGLEFRIDKSNTDLKYERNFIRHKIIPLIKKNLNPSVEQNIFNSSQVFRKTYGIINELKSEAVSKIVKTSEEYVTIDLAKLEERDKALLGDVLRDIVLYHFKKEFDFADYIKIESLLQKPTGRKISLSANLEAIKDRGKIIIYPKLNKVSQHLITIHSGEEKEICGKKISIRLIDEKKIRFDQNRNHEYISADELENKFDIRKWKAGDKFIPLGMKDYKNVSDFLIDEKISAHLKKDQLILLNRNQIVWIIGLRIDNRFKIKEKTKKVIELWIK